MKQINVYFAGKIYQWCWRNQLFKWFDRCEPWTILEKSIWEINMLYTWPYCIWDDHWCYHWDWSHWLWNTDFDPSGMWCDMSWNMSRRNWNQIYDMCMWWIKSSSVVFAWINDATAFGTLYEIWYAVAQWKIVLIWFENEQLAKDMWFMTKWSTFAWIYSNVVEASNDMFWKLDKDKTPFAI